MLRSHVEQGSSAAISDGKVSALLAQHSESHSEHPSKWHCQLSTKKAVLRDRSHPREPGANFVNCLMAWPWMVCALLIFLFPLLNLICNILRKKLEVMSFAYSFRQRISYCLQDLPSLFYYNPEAGLLEVSCLFCASVTCLRG